MAQVSYTQDRKIYEVTSFDGTIRTFFVFPPNLKSGDVLPPLFIHCFGDRDVIFMFYGEFNSKTDNMEFHIEGPTGYVYKASLSVDLPAQPYAWKIKRHGHTNVGKDNNATKLFVPRTLCLRPQTLIESEQDVVKRWAFYGPSVPDQFGKLRLKIIFQPSKCAQNPDNNFASLNQMVMSSSYNTSEDNEATPEKTNTEDAKASVAPQSFLVQSEFSPSSTGLPSQSSSEDIDLERPYDTSVEMPNTEEGEPSVEMISTEESEPPPVEMSSTEESEPSVDMPSIEESEPPVEMPITEESELSVHAGEKIGSFGIPRLLVHFKRTEDSGDKDPTLSFQNMSGSVCSSGRTNGGCNDAYNATCIQSNRAKGRCNDAYNATCIQSDVANGGCSNVYDTACIQSDVANGGCNDAYDAACIQSDDGLKLLDDSIEIKNCGMSSLPNYNCCGGPNSDISFGSSQSRTAEHGGDNWAQFVPNCNCRCLGPESYGTGANRTEPFGCGGVFSKIDSMCNGPPCEIRHSAKNDLGNHKSIASKFPKTLLKLIISEPNNKLSNSQGNEVSSMIQDDDPTTPREEPIESMPAVLVTLGVNVDVQEESEKAKSNKPKQASKPINFTNETSEPNQLEANNSQQAKPQSHSEQGTNLQNTISKPKATKNFKQNFTFSDIKVVAAKESRRGAQKEVPKSVSFFSEEDDGPVSMIASAETESSEVDAAKSFGMSEVADLKNQYHRNLEKRTSKSFGKSEMADLKSQYHRNLEKKNSNVTKEWQNKMSQVNAPARGKTPIHESFDGKDEGFKGQDHSVRAKSDKLCNCKVKDGVKCVHFHVDKAQNKKQSDGQACPQVRKMEMPRR